MARPRQTSNEEILKVARKLFLEHGPAVSTTVIAEKLGISHAILFQRFGTKEELLKAAVIPDEPSWMSDLVKGPDKRPMRAQLLDVATRVAADLQETVPRIAMLRASGLSADACSKDAAPLPLRTHHALSRWLRQAMNQGRVRECNPEFVAHVLLGSLMNRSFYRHLMREKADRKTDGAYVATVVDLIWTSLAPRARRTRERVS
jgi:AcrR family transcriptional regulator